MRGAASRAARLSFKLAISPILERNDEEEMRARERLYTSFDERPDSSGDSVAAEELNKSRRGKREAGSSMAAVSLETFLVAYQLNSFRYDRRPHSHSDRCINGTYPLSVCGQMEHRQPKTHKICTTSGGAGQLARTRATIGGD
jgi:hypothetical protein